jgi:hypothetical protein
VKLLPAEGDQLHFQVSKREKRLLLDLLQLYPLIPSTYHRLSRTADPAEVEANQRLLDEALAEQKRESRAQLTAWLAERDRFRPSPGGLRFCLSVEQAEWLLQILNDLRVGSWLKLGCPDTQRGPLADLSEGNVRYFLAMEFCAFVETSLLRALDART